jgi:hypothetical protein
MKCISRNKFKEKNYGIQPFRMHKKCREITECRECRENLKEHACRISDWIPKTFWNINQRKGGSGKPLKGWN